MKRFAIKSGPGNLRFTFSCVVAATLVLVGCRILVALRPVEDILTRKNFEPPGTLQRRGPRMVAVPTVLGALPRDKVSATGDFSLQINLLDSFPGAITQIGPKGDLLYSETVCIPQVNRIFLRNDHRNIQSFLLETGANLTFSPDGKLVKKQGFSQGESSISKGEVNLCFNDGSYLTKEVISKKPTRHLLQRIDDKGVKQTLYSSEASFTLLERSDRDVFWLRSEKQGRRDILVKVKGKKVEERAIPEGFTDVTSVSHTGDLIAATFGATAAKMPYRSFIAEGSSWRELPMPSDFECSFVQAITSDGLIFGLVSDPNSEVIRQIVWKGKAFQLLGAPPTWPSRKELPFVDKVTREGYVSFIDRSSEQGWKTYLYSIRPN